MMRKILPLFFVAITFGASAQTRVLDSLYALVKIHPEQDTVRVKLLYNICHNQLGCNIGKNLALATEALEISKKINYPRGIAASHRYLAYYHRSLSDYSTAVSHALEMARVSEECGYVRGVGLANFILGIIAHENNKIDKAREYYFKAVEYGTLAKNNQDVASAYMSLGNLGLEIENYDEAYQYLLKSQESYKNSGSDLGVLYNNIAIVHLNKGNYDSAKFYFMRALTLAEEAKHDNMRSTVTSGLGDLYIKLGQNDVAEKYLNISLEAAQDSENKRLVSLAYESLAEFERTRGRYISALKYHDLTDRYKDSVYTEENANRIAMMETRFESEKKDKQISDLNRDSQLQKVRNTYSIIGVGALSALFIGIYFLQRSHNKNTSSLLKVQQGLNEKLREMDQLKSRFFANISHEFRTPLSLILAPVEEKLSARPPKDVDSFLLIRRNAQRLLSLVNQVLDLSRLDAHKMELSVRKGNLKEMITIIASSFDSLSEARGIHFHRNIEVDQSLHWFDPDKLEKILNNLLFNAFKFTPAGGAVTLAASIDTNGKLNLSVYDTGIGISKEEQKHLFSPFFQSTRASNEGEGSGLGLALVKELVVLHGGTINVESEVDAGTTFELSLPVTRESFRESDIVNEIVNTAISTMPATLPSHEETDEEESDVSFADSVLIVEDNIDVRKYITGLLEDYYLVYSASDGDEGFKKALAHMPSLVVSDVMMPNIDGMQLTKMIKEDERTSHIPVVLLTAYADDHSKLSGLETGADDYLSKPFSTQELKARISNLIRQRKKLAEKYRTAISSSEPAVITETRELSHDEKFLARVKKSIDENLSDHKYGVEAMAAEIGLSRAQLFRKLKSVCGLSPNELLSEIRLNRAAEMIRAKADNFSQISYAVGYNESSYFARRFRNKFGMSPGEYQSKFAT
jgi:signal transduction histidine kinase/DNA-binding response OmpR family regulator